MSHYYQETDSKFIFASPQNPSYPIYIEPRNETIGGYLNTHFFPIPKISSLIKPAWNTTQRTENLKVSKAARKLLSTIEGMISSFEQSGFDLGYLPPLRASNLDDGSLLAEWVFKAFRVGFNVEPNPEESGWYFVTNQDLGNVSASGSISSMNTERLALLLLNFVITFS